MPSALVTDKNMVSIRGDRLKRLRKSQSLNQKQLADQVGVNQYQISRYENGIDNPSVGVLVVLVRALNTTADYLLGLSSVPHPGAEPDPYPDLTPTERDVVAILRQQDAKNQARLVEILRLAVQVPPPGDD